ncbi:MAG: EAL domain-containing protein [Hyphomonadaceae bacterium]
MSERKDRSGVGSRLHGLLAALHTRQSLRDVVTLIVFCAASYALAVRFDVFDRLHDLSRSREDWELDEIFGALLIASLGMIVFAFRRAAESGRELRLRIRAEERATRMALHDPLTGLPNRRRLNAILPAWINRASRDNPLAVIAVDLDRFKPVNDLYGHATGDAVLRQVAAMLRAESPEDAFVARIGGDEFVVLIAPPDMDGLLDRLSHLVASCAQPFKIDDYTISIGATLGVALAPTDGLDAELLLRRADAALYRGKEEGRGRFAFFEAGMDERVRERAAIERDLRRAVDADLIEPHYQPLVALGTGEAFGYEVLARWNDAERGMVSPELFIRIAEDIGVIEHLTLNLMTRACRETLRWRGAPRIALNVSPRLIQDARLPEKMLAVLGETGFPPGRLELEITEAALVRDFACARDVLTSLKNLGVHIALDDFGTGYSSLRHLRELPFDMLKIDQSFVRGMSGSLEARMMVKTILDLASNLGLSVIAEGVETEQLADELRSMGCELGQGFYYGRAQAGPDAAPVAGRVALLRSRFAG